MFSLKGAKCFPNYSEFRNVFLLFSFIILFLSFESCKSPTSPVTYRLSLSVTDVSCTEAWLNLSINNSPLPTNITIMKNGSSFVSFNLSSKDTTIYDSALQPNKTYSYQAEYGKGFVTEKSEITSAKTMDTTSNNFTWQTIVLGDGINNSFSDVEVVNDTSIWAVGLFSIQNSGTYNVAHWDGKSLNYIAAQFYTVIGQDRKSFYDASSILVFKDSTMWVSMAGDQIAVFKGATQTSILALPVSFGIRKMWGENSNSVYVAGDGGNILKYDGTNWQQIQSGTTLNIQDIWGVNDPIIGKDQILCIASNVLESNQNMLLQIKDGFAQVVSNQGLPPYYFSSVWFKDSRLAYLTGSGTFKSYDFFNNTGWTSIIPPITTYYSYSIRGNDLNDIFFCGSFGDIAHFNGIRWKDYLGNELQPFGAGNLNAISVKGNTVCAVGYIVGGNGTQAVIILGKRN